jgi:hypothetical protein
MRLDVAERVAHRQRIRRRRDAHGIVAVGRPDREPDPGRPPAVTLHHSPPHRITSTTLPAGTVAMTPKFVPGPWRRLVLVATRVA